MKLLKTLILVILLLTVMAVIAGLFMDPQWRVERRAQMTAPAATVYAYISRIRSWQEWTAWNTEVYPQMQISYSGPERGVGARQSWDDGSMAGHVQITAEDPGRRFEYVVSMEEGKHEMNCSLAVQPADAGSEVIWGCAGDSGGNPLSRLMMATYKPMIGQDFEKGLDNLQQRYSKGK